MKRTISLLFGTFLAFCATYARAQKSEPEPENRQKARAVIQSVIHAVTSRAIRKTPDGDSSLLVTLLNPNTGERDRVRNLGDTAVEVLAEYVRNDDGVHQWLALRLLSEFKSEKAFAAVLEFANHSRVREEAVTSMCGYPPERTRPILEKFASSDSDPEVRRAAKRCLDSYKNDG